MTLEALFHGTLIPKGRQNIKTKWEKIDILTLRFPPYTSNSVILE